MIIDGREIGPQHPPYIVAEASCNHGGKLDTALKLIETAKEAGADSIKFQCYTPDTITLPCLGEDFIIKDGPWKDESLWSLYSRTQTPFEWFPELFAHARKIGITPFASVFDKSAVDMLEKLDCPAYKIASMEITDLPLIEYAAKTGKPLIISMGMASSEERGAAAASGAEPGNRAFLICTSSYPTSVEGFGLFDLRMVGGANTAEFGISDHTVGIEIPVAATALGARIIEKHLMLGDERTEDFEFSMAPLQFAQMVRSVRNVWQAMQPPTGDPEQASRQARRSLYIAQDIKQGEPFTEENVRSIRPSYGMEPRQLPWVLTKSAACDLKRGTALKPEHIGEAR